MAANFERDTVQYCNTKYPKYKVPLILYLFYAKFNFNWGGRKQVFLFEAF